MAVTDIANSNLTFTGVPLGVQVTKVTDSSADWASVANSTYFYDKTDKLIHFKNSGGTVLEIFSAAGLTYFTEAEATTSPNNTVYVDSLTAAGSTTNVDVAIVPKGTGAVLRQIPDGTATAGNKRGANAIDFQSLRTFATQVASGTGAVILGGSGCTASGGYSIAGGDRGVATGFSSVGLQNGQASGQYSFAFGARTYAQNDFAIAISSDQYTDCIASGINSFASGPDSTASGGYSVALGGYSNKASGFSSYAFGRASNTFSIAGRQSRGYYNSATGDCQKSEFFLSVRTTGNTATTLTVGGGAAATTNQVILSNQSAYRFKGTIIGKQSGSTNASAWDVDGLIVRGANAAATTLIVGNVNLVSNTPAWGTPTLAADTTNGGLQVQVTGAAATNIQWTAVIETTEVIYA